jgi:integrase
LKIRSQEAYLDVIENHLVPGLGPIRLQKLMPTDIGLYFDVKRGEEKKLSESTLAVHQAILYSALEAAKEEGLVHENRARAKFTGKPKRVKTGKNDPNNPAKKNCWDAYEANRFLAVARKAGPQQASFYKLALELGLRKAELCGLKWEDVNLDQSTITIARQLRKPGSKPEYETPKSVSGSRTLDISIDAANTLAAQRKHQAEIKMRHRDSYRNHGFVFAKEEGSNIGDPLQMNNLSEREFSALVKEAGVRRIKFHGLRHTSATHALQNSVPIKVVSERLGHGSVTTTMETYAQALESSHKAAAETMGSIFK